MLKNKIKNIIKNQILSDVVKDCSDKVLETVIPTLNGLLSKNPFEIIQIKEGTRTREIKGVTHEKFPMVLKLVHLDIPVYLSGAAGSGKNVICKQIAEALGLDFYFTNAVTQEYKLTGFIDANGRYHETEFYKAFKNGGIFFLDELDASIPEVLVLLNAAIANRYFDFPNGKIEAHKDFRLIAAGNTTGTGADLVYTGRYALDGASLDRFSIVYIKYSDKIEEAITNKDTELINFCHEYRQIVKDLGINSIFSYRGLLSVTRLKGQLPLTDILNICIVKGLKRDDLSMIQSRMKNNNEYCKAFKLL